MALFDDPFDATRRLSRGGCACGAHASEAEHAAALSGDAEIQRLVDGAVMRALFPQDAKRRAFLRSVGAATAAAAVSQFFPTRFAAEAFAAAGAPEKKDLKVGFIPITCATPIIMAKPMGFYEKQGLNVDVVKTAGWAVIRDKTL
ncbi:ABC transporter substrate-binding protein, partial [uncultured Methylobacterium sp.]|uniref:ABC transporter substrate-binding protein n=1 Tax=uncultured Methylobacterium sp. TaxID=157278 RepID=UPI0035CB4485